MRLLEIFSSVQGEGLRAGEPSCFIRLSGCNFKCPFCDTQDVMKQEHFEMTSKELLNHIRTTKQITTAFVITGGEPLLQRGDLHSFISLLTGAFPKAYITIETNGSLRIPEDLTYFKNVLWSISPKFGNEIGYRSLTTYLDILRFNLKFGQKAQLKVLYDSSKGSLKDLLLNTVASLLEDNPNVDVIVQPLMPSKGGDSVEYLKTMITPESIEFFKDICEYPFKSLRLVGQLHKIYEIQ